MPRLRRIATAITAALTATAAAALVAAPSASASAAAPQTTAASGATFSAPQYARYVRYGESDRFTVTVTDGGVPVTTGTITFYGDGVQPLETVHPDSNGQASLTIGTGGMSLGVHGASATYIGTDGAFISIDMFYTLGKNAPALNYSPRGIPRVSHRAQFRYHVTLTSPHTTVTGQVKIYDGKRLIGSAGLVNGKATVVLSRLSRGLHTLTFRYSGNSVLNAEGWTYILLRSV